jgi:hypothetical protein
LHDEHDKLALRLGIFQLLQRYRRRMARSFAFVN